MGKSYAKSSYLNIRISYLLALSYLDHLSNGVNMTNELTLNDYQEAALTTAVYPASTPVDGIMYTTLGLAGEAGEIANKVKKILRDDRGMLTPERREDLYDELGDVLWYVAALAYELEIDLTEVAERNLFKLGFRKAEGTIHGEGDKR